MGKGLGSFPGPLAKETRHKEEYDSKGTLILRENMEGEESELSPGQMLQPHSRR